MRTDSTQVDRPPTKAMNILDVLLKYSAVLTVSIYLAGLFAWSSYIQKLGAPPGDDFELGNPQHFILGAYILAFVFMGSVLPIFAQAVIDHPLVLESDSFGIWFQHLKNTRAFRLGRASVMLLIPLEIAAVKVSMARRNGDPTGSTVQMGFWLVLSCLIVSLTLSVPEIAHRVSATQQAGFLLLGLVLLVGLSSAFGAALAETRTPHRAMLLIAPDAASGAEDLGLKLAKSPPDHSAPAISEAVDIAASFGRTYLVHLSNGRWLRINKDKVWALTDVK